MFKTAGRGLAAFLALLIVGAVLAAQLAQVAEARRTADELVSKFSLGVATIGDGEVSTGIYNTNSTSFAGDPRKALDVAVHQASKIRFLRGTYAFAHPWKSGRSDLQIEADPGAVFSVDGDDAVGLFDLAGDRVTLSRLRVKVDGWTNSQSVVKLSGKFQRIEDSNFEVVTTGGNTSTPMNLVEWSDAVEPAVVRTTFLPGIGARVLDIDHGNGGTFDDNVVRNETVTGVGGSGEALTSETRACYQIVRSIGGQQLSVRRNKVWGLGTVSTGELPVAFYFQRDHDGIDDDQGSPGTQQGGISFEYNSINNVAAARYLEFRGIIEFSISNNFFGPSLAAMNAAGDAAIVLDTETATATGETGITGSGVIQGNVFNNCCVAGSSANNLYQRRAKKMGVFGNVFHLANCVNPVLIDVDASSTTLYQGNYFDGDEANTREAIAFESGGGTYTVRCISIRNNMAEGLIGAICPGRAAADLTPYGTGTTYDDGGILFGSSGAIFPGRQMVLVDSAARTAAALTYPPTGSPTFQTIPNITTYADINKACVVIADQLERMRSGAGPFVTQLTNSITGADGASPTVLGAVDSIQHAEDALNDLVTAMNSALGQSLSIRGRRIRYMATITADVAAADIGGVTTSDAFSVLTDSTGGAPVASLPQVTDDASAASAISLLATGFDQYIRNLAFTTNLVAPTTAGV